MAGSAESPVRVHVRVSGRVQGVAYRAFTQEAARRHRLKGGVRNLDDGRVEVEAEGARADVEGFLALLRAGPPLARVTGLEIEWEASTGLDADFAIWY